MEETGKKLIDKTGHLQITVSLDWEGEMVTVSVDKETNVATMLYGLLLGYNSVVIQAEQMLDKPAGVVLQ